MLIGHSQGAFVLEQLIAKDVDAKPAVRERMLSAILLGGNVLVKRGQDVGGSFQHIPACRSDTQLGCVIAFSTFDQPPPANSLFGRTTVAGEQVLCTNPAALGGGAGKVDPIFPSAPFAPGHADRRRHHAAAPHPADAADRVELASPAPTARSARRPAGPTCCRSRALGGAQTPTPSPDPTWGLHLLDANIELGNLLSVVHARPTPTRRATRRPGST